MLNPAPYQHLRKYEVTEATLQYGMACTCKSYHIFCCNKGWQLALPDDAIGALGDIYVKDGAGKALHAFAKVDVGGEGGVEEEWVLCPDLHSEVPGCWSLVHHPVHKSLVILERDGVVGWLVMEQDLSYEIEERMEPHWVYMQVLEIVEELEEEQHKLQEEIWIEEGEELWVEEGEVEAQVGLRYQTDTVASLPMVQAPFSNEAATTKMLELSRVSREAESFDPTFGADGQSMLNEHWEKMEGWEGGDMGSPCQGNTG
ncbi:hypothetical protein DACRYDRAFT_112159 [Dacryopinax primogenitus]|uniref:Uncharacterized protein n=1 Tax=Dacryopinax primogenitus (strain DJM 731) TaxID=1858805 RepID=M5FQY6_DACPD|nr:uncharacterized protein DACRYDRAFT_112159 [Dacryopinax primogenitus]EJT97209.1 hypothetical protein DACRYDRAFT_112159 [Dacryopinax primogenitus]